MSICALARSSTVRSLVALSAVLFPLGAKVCLADNTPAAAPATPPHLDLHSSPYRPSVGDSAKLEVRIKTPDGKAMAIPKETELTLYVIRDDLGEIFLEQPKLDDDGAFREDYTFHSGGDWRVFGEIVPDQGAPSLTDMSKVTVDGARPIRASLVPQIMPLTAISGYTLAMKQPTHIAAGTDQTLVFSLRNAQAQPVTDTDLWLGAIAHLVLIDRDGKTLIHAPTDANDPRTGRSEYLVFPVHFPKDGIWRGWVLFHRGGQQTSIPFVIRVQKG